jgi:nucleotide-binding universal stress UspA family protein
MSSAPLEKIILYVDASESALDAARYATALAKAYGAQLQAPDTAHHVLL